MLRIITSAAVVVVASFLFMGGISEALTLDEAKAQVEKQAAEKRLTAGERTAAVENLQKMVQNGVPAEYAAKVVDASINAGIKGKELAAIAHSIVSVPSDARDEAAAVAAYAAPTPNRAIRGLACIRRPLHPTNAMPDDSRNGS